MTAFRKDFRLFTILAGCILVSACFTWHAQTGIPPAAAEFDSTKTYRVTLQNGERRIADHPRISGDSLTWAEPVPEHSHALPKRPGIPLSEIYLVEVQGTSVGRTLLGAYFAIALLYSVVTCCPTGAL
jgi:hypothetical protein